MKGRPPDPERAHAPGYEPRASAENYEPADQTVAGKATSEADHSTVCGTCEYARAHGGWPPAHRGTHCSTCHLSWTGLARAHCTVCHALFATDGTARLHWSGGGYDAVHIDPAKVIDKTGAPKLVRDSDGIWHQAGNRPGYFAGLSSEAPNTLPSTSVAEGVR